MKKNKSTIILILVFFVGLSVMLYPTISDYVNQRNQSRAVASYAQDVDAMTDADYSAYFDAADAFNAQVAANENALYRPDQLTGYNETLDITGTGIMGYITISKIGVELPTLKLNTTSPLGLYYNLESTNGTLDVAYLKFNEVKTLTVELAEVETSVIRLAEAIQKTQKRANALGNVQIPQMQKTIKSIDEVLSEREREEFSRLKVIKAQKEKEEA